MDLISGWCKSKRKLHGSTVIITGSNSGIGKETALDLYQRGACVIMACRNLTKAETAKCEIEDTANENKDKGTLIIEELDLSSLSSVKQFATRVLEKYSNINILINNAGVMMCPEGKTEDGFETHMGSNHFGHALLTLLLLPTLIKNAPSRIVTVSSYLHRRGGKPPSPPPSNPESDKIVEAVLGPALDGIPNIYDSDAGIQNQENVEAVSVCIVDNQPFTPNTNLNIESVSLIGEQPCSTEKTLEISETEEFWSSWTPKNLKRPISDQLRSKENEENWLKRRRPKNDCLADTLTKEKIILVKKLQENAEKESSIRLAILEEQLKQEKIKTEKLMKQSLGF